MGPALTFATWPLVAFPVLTLALGATYAWAFFDVWEPMVTAWWVAVIGWEWASR